MNTMMGIGIGAHNEAYKVTDSERTPCTVCVTSAWMESVFGTRDLTLVTRYIGQMEFRVLCRRDVSIKETLSVIGDEIRGPVVVFGYDRRRDEIRDLTVDEVATLVWATRLCRWDDDGAQRMVVAVEMYAHTDKRCPFEVME